MAVSAKGDPSDSTTSSSQGEKGEKSKGGIAYTKEHPLVYEDVWDLWPYSFLDEEGEPEGFNIDLIKMLMNELNIPYIIKLKPSGEAFRDLRDGRSDLMLGLQVGFHDEFGRYSENAVTLHRVWYARKALR